MEIIKIKIKTKNNKNRVFSNVVSVFNKIRKYKKL